jgi:hypothetical protein
VGVHLATEHPPQLEPAHLFLDLRHLALEVEGGRFVILGLGQLQQLDGGLQGPLRCIDLLDVGGQPRPFLAEVLRALGLRPYRRILQLSRDLLEPLFLGVVLKETPLGRRGVPRSP